MTAVNFLALAGRRTETGVDQAYADSIDSASKMIDDWYQQQEQKGGQSTSPPSQTAVDLLLLHDDDFYKGECHSPVPKSVKLCKKQLQPLELNSALISGKLKSDAIMSCSLYSYKDFMATLKTDRAGEKSAAASPGGKKPNLHIIMQHEESGAKSGHKPAPVRPTSRRVEEIKSLSSAAYFVMDSNRRSRKKPELATTRRGARNSAARCMSLGRQKSIQSSQSSPPSPPQRSPVFRFDRKHIFVSGSKHSPDILPSLKTSRLQMVHRPSGSYVPAKPPKSRGSEKTLSMYQTHLGEAGFREAAGKAMANREIQSDLDRVLRRHGIDRLRYSPVRQVKRK